MVVWLALAFLVLAFAGSLAFALVRGLETWRALKRVGRGAGDGLARIERATAEIDLHLQAATSGGERLTAALDRLQSSRARLNVLTSALAQSRAAFGRLGAVYPRK